jgi:hypothetical protein
MTATKHEAKQKTTRNFTNGFYRFMYWAFVALAIYFFATRQFGSAMSNLGLALMFDPFRHEVTWTNRPRYQKVWLIAHIALLLILVGLVVVNRWV